jgi:two-component system, LytTR family, response regulator
MPPTVFVTAYDAHAIRAFELHATDYLLKPFDDTRFGEALRHVRRQIGQARDSDLGRRLVALLGEVKGEGARDPLTPRTHATRILVRRGDRLELLPLDSADWIAAAGELRPAPCRPARRTGAHRARRAARAARSVGVRAHPPVGHGRVNVRRIRSVHRWFGGDYTVSLSDARELRVSRHYRKTLLKTVS